MRRLNILTIFLVLGLVFTSNLRAEVATVTGKITQTGNRPARNITVSIGEKFNFTDVQGRYIIKDVPFGEHTIQIMEGGQVLKQEKIEINQPRIQYDKTIR